MQQETPIFAQSLLKPKAPFYQSDKRDYHRKKILGSGAYGRVELVEKDGIQYALKIIDKKQLEKNDTQYQPLVQREVLSHVDHPGVIKLFNCSQDHSKLYLLLEYCEGGDLIEFIQNQWARITPALKIFYIAQIVSILEYLQGVGIIHRDLKPQNIMLGKDGHLKLIDFATAQVSDCTIISESFKTKLREKKFESQCLEVDRNNSPLFTNSEIIYSKSPNESDLPTEQPDTDTQNPKHELIYRPRKATFVGTCFYLPPEMIERNESSFANDLWALGCIIYQLYYCKSPFESQSEYETFDKILNMDYLFPENDEITPEAIDLIRKLLQKNPEDRLGCGSRKGLMLEDLKKHPFFSRIKDFSSLYGSDVPPLAEITKDNLNTDGQLLGYYINHFQEDPNIIYQGIVEKRTFISYNKYYLVVYENLSLARIKIHQPKKYVHRDISVDHCPGEGPAQLLEPDFFKLTTKNKVYKLKSSQAQKWVQIINGRYKQLKAEEQEQIEDQLNMEEGNQSNGSYTIRE